MRGIECSFEMLPIHPCKQYKYMYNNNIVNVLDSYEIIDHFPLVLSSTVLGFLVEISEEGLLGVGWNVLTSAVWLEVNSLLTISQEPNAELGDLVSHRLHLSSQLFEGSLDVGTAASTEYALVGVDDNTIHNLFVRMRESSSLRIQESSRREFNHVLNLVIPNDNSDIVQALDCGESELGNQLASLLDAAVGVIRGLGSAVGSLCIVIHGCTDVQAKYKVTSLGQGGLCGLGLHTAEEMSLVQDWQNEQLAGIVPQVVNIIRIHHLNKA